jgi:hypothetical protein
VNLRLFASKGNDRATLWLWDWISLAISSLTALPLVSGLLDGAVSALVWLVVGVVVGATFMTHRITIRRDQPFTAHVTTFVFGVPVRRREFDVRQLATRHDDDWTTAAGKPHDELIAGAWSMSCRRAADVAAWLRASSSELATPRASVRS